MSQTINTIILHLLEGCSDSSDAPPNRVFGVPKKCFTYLKAMNKFVSFASSGGKVNSAAAPLQQLDVIKGTKVWAMMDLHRGILPFEGS
jgi:hypothetical protein